MVYVVRVNSKIIRWILIGMAATIIVVGAIFLLVPAELKEGTYSTYTIDYGTVIKTVKAQGVVEPENEVLLNSPASTMVKKINYEPGSRVESGTVLLQLDADPIKKEIEGIEDQLKIKRNNLTKLKLTAKSTRLDLDFKEETKKLRIAAIKSELVDQEQLLEVGGISKARYDKTQQELVSAQKDLEMTQTKNQISLKQLKAEENGLKLQIEIQEKDLAHKKNLIQKMYFRAPSDGIVLSITKKEGEKIRENDLLVKMSNLSTFKIKGEIDEASAENLKTGKLVYALLDKEKLKGKVGTIQPVIENNKLYFDVYIDSANHPKLIANQKIDLLLVRYKKDSVLRVANGPCFNKASKQTFYVVKGTKAVATEVVTGLKGDEFIYIKSGVQAGDKVIINDVSAFRKAKTIHLN